MRPGPLPRLLLTVGLLAAGAAGAWTATRGTTRAPAPATTAAPVAGLPAPRPCSGCWNPPLVLPFQVQYTGRIDLSIDARLFDLDGVDTPKATVDRLHAKGRRVACYFSAGSHEDWRPDAGRYPARLLGAPLDGWPGERWVDIRDVRRPGSALAAILRARLDLCARKGFDAVDPDNVDGYTHTTGFALTAADQLHFNAWLAGEAHARGLAVALKNDPGQAAALVRHFDFAVTEQCHEFEECDALLPFVRAGKPVLQIEYGGDLAGICAAARARRFNAVKKRVGLDAWRAACP